MMRLRRLTLERFGHFSGKVLDFGARTEGKPDFHLIYGLNESGKTTIMEGYLRLLYGFPTPRYEQYAFQHEPKNLSVSGDFELNGKTVFYERRPVTGKSLFNENGIPVSDEVLQDFIGDLQQEDYRKLLCLDDKTIEEGGDEILKSKGEIDRLLFSAAAGIGDLSDLLDKVEKDAAKLYRKRGSNKFVELKEEISELKRHIAEIDVSASDYRSRKQSLDTALGHESEVVKKREALYKKKAHLDRLRIMLEKRGQLQGEKNDQRQKLETLTRQLDAIKLNPALLGIAADLDLLEEKYGRFQTADTDLPKRQTEINETLSAMQRSAEELGLKEGADPTALVISSSQLEELEQIREAITGAENNVANAKRELDTLTESITETDEKLASLRAKTPEGKDVSEILEKYDVTTLETNHANARYEVDDAKERFDIAFAGIAINGQTFDAIPVVTMNSNDAGEIVDKLRNLKAEQTSLQNQLDAAKTKSASHINSIDEIKAQSGITSDADADAALIKRDELWARHKNDLSLHTASAFEKAMKFVDEISNKRLAAAEDLGSLRQMQSDLKEQDALVKSFGEKIKKNADEREKFTSQFTALAKKSGLQNPPMATDLVKWLSAIEEAQRTKARHDDLASKHAPIMEKAKSLIADVAKHMDITNMGGEFANVMLNARKQADNYNLHLQKIATEEKQLKDFSTQKDRREKDFANAKQELAQAEENWADLIAKLFSVPVNSDILRSSLKPIRDIQRHNVTKENLESRIKKMNADREEFTVGIMDLAKKYGISVGNAPKDAHQKLKDEGKKAKEAETSARICKESIGNAESALDKADKGLAEIAKQADNLGENLDATTLSEVSKKISLLDGDIQDIEIKYKSAISDRSAAETELKEVTGGANVAQLVENKTTRELELVETALEYLRLTFGHRIAVEAIRRFRDKHHRAMVDATQRAFAKLTNDAYTQLKTKAEKGAEIFLAVNKKGMTKRAKQMSKGTRFQLYLALRVAAYEQIAGRGVVLPLFCDDIFETFDDPRTRSACILMGDIGKIGQAIYLTHHKHVVDIARDVCGENVKIHEIATP